MLGVLDWLARGSSNSLVQATHAQFFLNPDYLTQDWDVLKTLVRTVFPPFYKKKEENLAMMVMKKAIITMMMMMMMMMAVVGGDGSSGG